MKLLRLFVAVLLVAAPTLSYGQGVPATQIPQGRGAIMYIMNADGTFSPVSEANPLTVSGSFTADNEADITAVGGNPVTDELPTHDADLLAAMASEVPAGDEEIGKTTPTITNLISGTITSDMTGTTSTSLIAAPGSNLTNYITHVGCSNMDADTDTIINLQDGNGGTTFYHGVAAKLGGGFSYTLSPPLKQPTANTALYVVNVTSGATTRCSASGFKR